MTLTAYATASEEAGLWFAGHDRDEHSYEVLCRRRAHLGHRWRHDSEMHWPA